MTPTEAATMPLEIRSTRITREEVGASQVLATVELLISDNEVEGTAVETLQLQLRLDISDDTYHPAIQVAVLKRARKILEQVEASVRAKWGKRT